ncbi:MAG: isoprenyl transferase [Candidatus Omnitrophota bacterium]|nr:isoprenyl transferase [Candidatus Omnitrophota bacterium]
MENGLPQHIAIIMDGNGRWAHARRLPRTAGHRKGIDRIRKIIKAADELGIKVLTLFAFSTENWSRPKREVDMLMNSMERFLKKEINDLHKRNIKFMTIGAKVPIPESLQKTIIDAQELTKNNSGLIVNLALNYGSRSEIVNASKNIVRAVIENQIKIEDINENTFTSFLYTSGLPDPDLLIRTSAELRISNFLLWQLSYAELYFTKKFWPDFGAEDLKEAILNYQKRDRRFGEIKT